MNAVSKNEKRPQLFRLLKHLVEVMFFRECDPKQLILK